MKNLKNLFIALALCAPLTAAAQDIEINEENFPDENFRNWLLGQDYGTDGIITEAEIEEVTYIYVSHNNITSLKGIEYFTALTELSCGSNLLTALDVSKNTALTYLYCPNNQFTALDVSNNTALTALHCYNNLLTALDVSKNTALTILHCYSNQIKGESMDALVSYLPETMSGELYVYSEHPYFDNEGNIITKSQVAAAKAKGWTPYYYSIDVWDWKEYEGSDDSATRIALSEIESSTAEVYTLHGQKVTTPQTGGIYIVNGKKVVVK